MKRFGLVFTLTLLLTASALYSQFNPQIVQIKRGTPSLSVGMQLNAPVADYNEALNQEAFGMYGMLMLSMGNSPFEVGAKASFLRNGSERDDIYMYAGSTSDGDEVYEEVNLIAKSTVRQYTGVLRLEPLRNRVQVYGDLMAGFTNYGLRTRIETNDDFEDKIGGDLVYTNSALTYGWAAGLKVQLVRGVMMEGRFENLRGNNARYVDPESIWIGKEGELDYNILESKTNSYNFHLGVSLEF